MPFILDASVTVSWAFPDEFHPVAARAEEILGASGESAIVPGLWWYEVRNALLVSEKRGRTTPDRTSIFLSSLASLPIVIAPRPEPDSLLDLARTHGLSAYDAAYLALAIREHVPLASLDMRLMAAARASNIPLWI
jgi:predicted nucleic acid-binding protein